jgi:hypothetical protein
MNIKSNIETFLIGGFGLLFMNYLFNNKDKIPLSAFVTIAPFTYFMLLIMNNIRQNKMNNTVDWVKYSLYFSIVNCIVLIINYALYSHNINKILSTIISIVIWICLSYVAYIISK